MQVTKPHLLDKSSPFTVSVQTQCRNGKCFKASSLQTSPVGRQLQFVQVVVILIFFVARSRDPVPRAKSWMSDVDGLGTYYKKYIFVKTI